MSVNPDLLDVLRPFSKVSLSSKPGSPNDTELSNHPFDICRFSKDIIFSSFTLISFSIFLMIPDSINKSFF